RSRRARAPPRRLRLRGPGRRLQLHRHQPRGGRGHRRAATAGDPVRELPPDPLRARPDGLTEPAPPPGEKHMRPSRMRARFGASVAAIAAATTIAVGPAAPAGAQPPTLPAPN